MNGIGAIALGASVLMVATVASGRARSSEVPGASQATPAQSVPAGNESRVPQSTPIFTIGGVVGFSCGLRWSRPMMRMRTGILRLTLCGSRARPHDRSRTVPHP
jgi:hypothetical protein